uniref:Endonuclease/exonuclease/phosphatase domain-containing protein n=1 Tax=Trichogramma kaykai TaxID=54128 RepID=A0ABD2XRS7_9HYME
MCKDSHANFNLNILQWNSRGIRSKVETAEVFKDYDIIVICETFLKEHDNYQLKGYNIARFDRNSIKGGGLAILLKKNICFDTLVIDLNLNQIEIGAITIETTVGLINLIAYYRSPSHTVGNSFANWKNEWHKLTDYIKTLDNFIFLGDFNAHHPWWGSDHSCPYGSTIYESIDLEYFALFNDGSPTHFSVSNNAYSTSNIDLTFVSSNLLLKFPEWKVLSDSYGSDHFPIAIGDTPEPYGPYELFYETINKEQVGKIYLGDGISTTVVNWELLKESRDSNAFLCDLARTIWGKKLKNICLDYTKVKNSIPGKGPVQLANPTRLELYLRLFYDFLQNHDTVKNFSNKRKHREMRLCPRNISWSIRDRRGNAINLATRNV